MRTQISMTKYYKTLMMMMNQLKTKKLVQVFLAIIPFLILLIMFSCEEDPSSLGSNLLPDSDKIGYTYDTSLTFKGNVFKNKPISTSNLQYYSLGIINDENFGIYKGEFAGEFLPSSYFKNDSVPSGYRPDSLVLFLTIDTIYGIPQGKISFNVYELNSEIDDDLFSDENINNYYSSSDLINTNCIFSGDTLVKFTLSSEFTNKLIPTEEQDTSYKNHSNFLSIYKGLALIPVLTDPTGEIYNVNISSKYSKILLYHNDTMEFSYKFNFIESNIFANYTNDYNTSIVNNYLTNPEDENDDLLFLQGINGVSSKITFTNIDSWFEDDSSYSILNAELIVPVFKDDNFDQFYPPEKLFFYYSKTDSSLFKTEDEAFGDYFDGSYNEEENNYHFNISKHLMRMLSREIKDSCLNFNIVNKSSYPHRVIFESSENIKLNVTYTKH